ncbi:hypothetical protein AMTRI_Chr09g22510 [Amborella trichopoda]|uniref:LysM domain-containing protein n=1 Tax=Amborella trichopoda TaxID=13333 RepID=U5DAZ3_AMBTC|nr:hypothetical protein AMTR_s00069p00157890 [Amborella trichopoda]
MRESPRKRTPRPSSTRELGAIDMASWYFTLLLVSLIVLGFLRLDWEATTKGAERHHRRTCDEIYVVEEGETLHTIGEKCGDPYIVETNPHIQDPDDVFPGLVIKITPSHVRD